MALSISDVNSACDRIHSLVQMSGLHFLINQTPWSSYITIRRKFVNPGAFDLKTKPTETAIIDQLKERNKNLELKVAELEYHLEELEEESKSEKENHEKNVEHFNNRISTLEKETKIKDVMIQNINAHFNMKVSDLSTKVEELEAVKKESIKKEKKALKKQRQKVLKQADKSNVEPVDKDLNENLLLVHNFSDISEPSLPLLHNNPIHTMLIRTKGSCYSLTQAMLTRKEISCYCTIPTHTTRVTPTSFRTAMWSIPSPFVLLCECCS